MFFVHSCPADPFNVEFIAKQEVFVTFLPRSPRGCGLALAVAGAALSLSCEPAKAGFFDFLFQPQQPAPEVYAPHPRRFHDSSRHHLRPAKRHAAKARHSATPVALLHPKWEEKDHCCKVAGAPRPAPVLLEDDSLREGDAVMTRSGLKVFTGEAGSHHRMEDFAALSETKNISKRVRKILLEIDPPQAERRNAEIELSTGRSAAAGQLATGAMIVDPKGNTIRYVGP
jgi:hypothetical protein